MKKLYHGSLEIVRNPEIREPNRTLDYGAGFYLTSSSEQAEAWVRRKLRNGITYGFVNVYDYEESLEAHFNVLSFELPDENWIDFVMKNRMDISFRHKYDIVKGPVANDRVYASFALYEAGLLDKQELINDLKAYKLVNQYLIHSPKALVCLNWKDAAEIRK